MEYKIIVEKNRNFSSVNLINPRSESKINLKKIKDMRKYNYTQKRQKNQTFDMNLSFWS